MTDEASFDWAPRPDFITVEVVQNRRGSWDVVLDMDGGYGTREDAESMAEFFSRITGRPRGDRLALEDDEIVIEGISSEAELRELLADAARKGMREGLGL